MRYEWNDWALDRNGGGLKRQGEPVEASRKVVECIRHLIVHRERIVGYDELIRSLWGHDNVSNHQLSQVVLAARRLLGDDGQAQRCIRTATGQGYHWVAPVVENTDGTTAAAAAAMDDAAARHAVDSMPVGATPTAAHAGHDKTAPGPAAAVEATDPDTGTHATGASAREPIGTPPAAASFRGLRRAGRRRRRLAFAALAACATAAAALGILWLHQDRVLLTLAASSEGHADADTFDALRRTLAAGRHDDVREALSALPPRLAESREAMLIAIDLDIQRGRFDRAREKIDAQSKTLRSPRDHLWHARLLMRESVLNSRRQAPGAEVFAPADAAVTLLLSQGGGASQRLLAEALRVRANGYNLTHRSDAALRDLAEALDIHEREGDTHRMAMVRATRARTWMRMGRMTDALDELGDVAEAFQRHEDKVNEVLARNTLAKIQIESLQWQAALASTERSLRLLRGMQDSDRRYPTLQLRAMALIGVGRLREADSLLDEAEAGARERRDGIIPAIHHLETGQPQRALEAAAREFETSRIDTHTNLLLENREGALLLWMMAAQAMVDDGQTPPAATVAQLALLESPTNAVARIARGHWLSLQGEDAAAERELLHSLQEAQDAHQRLRMLLAAEPLVDLALRRGDTAAARQVVDGVYDYDPDAMGEDYRFHLLRLRIALADGTADEYDGAHRKVLQLAGERRLPRGVERLYAERRHRDGGPLWSGPVAAPER